MTAVSSIRFVLFEPTHPGNIGSVARALKTMGFSELVLVNPPEEWLCADSRALASGAQDVLHGARVVTTPGAGPRRLWTRAGRQRTASPDRLS